MADIQYINYGDLQIEQLALLNNLSDNVYKYVLRQPWSNKKKEKFMSAYQDIMSRGVLGASNSTGEWRINVGGDVMPTMDKKDREMYEEAAYFIQLLMAGLPTKASEELAKEEEKSELPTFDNDAFITDFRKHISSTRGGQPFVIDDKWNNLDSKRNEKGERERTERTKKLLEYLEGYKNKFNSSKYSFKDSPFENDADFKFRLDKAIQALKSPELSDDNDALMNLGLNPDDWFNNGTGDAYTGDKDFTGTYGQYYNEYLPQKLKEKEEAEAKQLEYISQFGIRSSRPLTNLVTRRALADKYGNLNTLIALLGDYGDKLDLLNSEELDEVISALSYGATLPISDDEWNILKANTVYANSNRNRFKKLPGVDNLIYDTSTKRAILIYDKSLGIDFIAGLGLKDLQKSYETLSGFSPSELREVAALILDLAAAADPEGFSSAGLSLIASGIRDYNRSIDPEGWTWGDTGEALLDHGLGLLSLIPVAGGWVKGGLAISKLSKYLPKIELWIRYIGRAGSTYAMASNSSGALNTLDKIKNGEDVTLKEYQDLAYFFIGALGHHLLNRSNRIERTAMKARGLDTTDTIGNKFGFTRTKPITETNNSTLKIKVGENEVEVPITDEVKSKIGKMSPEDRSKLSKSPEALKAAEEYLLLKGIKIKDDKGNYTEEWKNATITYNPSWRDKSLLGLRLPEPLRSNGNSFGTTTNKLNLNWNTPEQFELYLSDRTLLGKIFSGSNRDIRRYDRNYLGNIYLAKHESSYPKTTKEELNEGFVDKGLWGLLPNKGYVVDNNPIDNTVPRDMLLNKSIMKRWRDILNGKFSKKDMEEAFKEGIKIGNENVRLSNIKDSSGNPLISIYTSKGLERFKSLEDAKKFIAKLVKEQRTNITGGTATKQNIKELGRVLLELKKKGWLKQGGRIDKQKIQIYKKYIGG